MYTSNTLQLSHYTAVWTTKWNRVKFFAIHTHTRHPAVCLCELCGNTFTKASSLKKHQRTIHAKTVRFPCHCGRVFKRKANLNSHVMIVHLPDINQQLLKNSKEKQVIHSDKTYSNQYKCAGCVSGHFVRYTHTKHPPVCTCEQCGKTFTEVGDTCLSERRIWTVTLW